MTAPAYNPGPVVPAPTAQLSPTDKTVLCGVICHCNANPSVGKSGQSLKQQCVSANLKAHDASLLYQSHYKAEFTYDMTKKPPEPFIDKTIPTKSRELWRGWTNTLWPSDPRRPRPFVRGRGYIRRPDVVIVIDPTVPPIQSNIKQVVEMKFPGDSYRPRQLQDYIRIAGGPTKMISLTLHDCGCVSKQQVLAPSPNPKTALEILAIIQAVVTKRPLAL